ncbi:hypothetical protein EVAR_72979_1 [Eumeta japonica]|uniref:Uncharacterized protein n=1 Tax=Eumeta variegata TaxID=151549 RepID=A0A4C2AE20_EUMVA|nr:hypothetical protein EVAR_72979_1 [Eumeta japonica]
MKSHGDLVPRVGQLGMHVGNQCLAIGPSLVSGMRSDVTFTGMCSTMAYGTYMLMTQLVSPTRVPRSLSEGCFLAHTYALTPRQGSYPSEGNCVDITK